MAHPTPSDLAAVYDRIAAWFDRNRDRSLIERPYLDALAAALAPGAAILDLGCGTGEPILRALLVRGFAVTGVDASAAMIAIARARFPDTPLLVGDMRDLADLADLAFERRFDAVVAWHSLFHLAPADQQAMFPAFARLLHPGGLLMFTSGSTYGETWSENGGEALYHASLDTDAYRGLLEGQGFRVLRHAVDDPACGGATVWIAQYLPGESVGAAHETTTRL